MTALTPDVSCPGSAVIEPEVDALPNVEAEVGLGVADITGRPSRRHDTVMGVELDAVGILIA